MESGQSLLSGSAVAAACLCYSYYLSPWIRPGKLRLLSLLPIISLLTYLPFLFSTILLRGMTFLLSWLTAFKLLLLSFNRGPLSHPLPLPTFLVLASLPVQTHQPKTHLRPPINLLAYPLKASALFTLITFISHHRHASPRSLILALYGVVAYLTLDLALAACAAVARLVLGPGSSLDPQFRAPYLSSSLQDFWGNRWNIMVSRVLHAVVYEPVRSRLGIRAGVVACFFVSGLAHEALFYCATLERQTGEATCFFVLQGVCVVLEIEVKLWLRRKGWRALPRAVAAPMTVAFVTLTAMVLLYPPLMRGGAEERVMEEYEALVGIVCGCFQKLPSVLPRFHRHLPLWSLSTS